MILLPKGEKALILIGLSDEILYLMAAHRVSKRPSVDSI